MTHFHAGAAASTLRRSTGGGTPANLPTGYYVQPTLLADVDPTSTIAQTEIFGPVLTVTPYDTDDEAIAIANNTIFLEYLNLKTIGVRP